MLIWRIIYLVLFFLGTLLMLMSAFKQNSHYLGWSYFTWGVTLIIWFIVEKLYGDFTMPKSTQQHTSNNDVPIFTANLFNDEI